MQIFERAVHVQHWERTNHNEYIDILSFAEARCNDAGETRYIWRTSFIFSAHWQGNCL